MTTLENHLEKLSGWLRSQGVPTWEYVLFAEDIHVDPFSKQMIEESSLHTLIEFTNRFDELSTEGYNWLNFSGLGILDNTLIVVIEKPNTNTGCQTTSVNQSGPPNCVKDNDYNLEQFIEIKK